MRAGPFSPLSFHFPKQLGDKLDEQSHSRNPALVRRIEHVDRRGIAHVPFDEHRHKPAAAQVAAYREVGQARDPLALECRIEHNVAMAADQPTSGDDCLRLPVAFELPEIVDRAVGHSEKHADMALEIHRLQRNTVRGPIAGRSANDEAGLPDDSAHKVRRRVEPAPLNINVDGSCVGVRRPRDVAYLDLQIGIADMKSGQCIRKSTCQVHAWI